MNIGDVEIPIVAEITPLSEADVEEIKPLKAHSDSIDSVPVKHEPSVTEITITGFLNEEVHSEHLSLNEQEQEVDSLRDSSKFDNHFTYKDYKGRLLVEDVNIVQDGEYKIVKEVEIIGRYFPWPKYCPESEPQ